MAETASNLAIPPARLAQIGESVRSRPFVLVTTGLESVGLKALVEQKAFEAEEKKIKIMESFVSALAKMALPSEDDEVMEVKWCFQNKAFLGAWTILVDELDAFKSDSVFFATTSPEDVAKAMAPIAHGDRRSDQGVRRGLRPGARVVQKRDHEATPSGPEDPVAHDAA